MEPPVRSFDRKPRYLKVKDDDNTKQSGSSSSDAADWCKDCCKCMDDCCKAMPF